MEHNHVEHAGVLANDNIHRTSVGSDALQKIAACIASERNKYIALSRGQSRREDGLDFRMSQEPAYVSAKWSDQSRVSQST